MTMRVNVRFGAVVLIKGVYEENFDIFYWLYSYIWYYRKKSIINKRLFFWIFGKYVDKMIFKCLEGNIHLWLIKGRS